MRILVLGSSGFLGSYLGFALPRLGHQVFGVSRSAVSFFPKNRVASGPEEFSDLILSGTYDVVVNCVAVASHEACEANPEYAHTVNAVFPGMWARAAQLAGAQFVQISTDAVFDGESGELYVEQDVLSPTSQYGKSKAMGESLVLENCPSALVVRTNFFGWSRDRNVGVLDFFLNAARSQAPVTGFQDYAVSSLYMGDLVDSIVGLVKISACGVFHLASSTVLSKLDFGILVSEESSLGADNITPGFIADERGMVDRGRNLGLSSQKARLFLGIELPSTAYGIQRAFGEQESVENYFHTGPLQP